MPDCLCSSQIKFVSLKQCLSLREMILRHLRIRPTSCSLSKQPGSFTDRACQYLPPTANMPSTEKSRPPQEEADIPYWRLITDNGYVDNTIATHECSGDGTEESPYLVEWLPGDARNPLNWSMSRKVAITLVVALSSLSVAFCSSAYLSPASQLEDEFDTDIVVRSCTLACTAISNRSC